ncbi:hypothetical protein BTO14_11350 [Polaribacter butkevichii]|uniref:Secretion system C-terminal sorting domain-containing protein n=2 Tax=Polaribacter butkevichii TaxID=218490 RepID=A0A2P6C6U7_9FLAO|nr:hypothetical protein BTO14_11350 [Polaribacter butkevichii]
MTKKTFFNITFLLCCSILIYGQANNTENCIKVWRTTDNEEALITFSFDQFTIPPNTTRYIQMMINYKAQPDIAIQVASKNGGSDAIISSLIRPTEKYTNLNTWQTIVFPISAQEEKIEVNSIIIFPDLGFKNEPAIQILNNMGEVGYIDEIMLLENSTLSTDAAFLNNNVISIQPNPVKNTFKILTEKAFSKVSFFDSLGKEITKSIRKINLNEYDISNLSTGLYFIKYIDKNNVVETLKIVKQ